MPEPQVFKGEVKINAQPNEPIVYPTVAGVFTSGEEFMIHLAERDTDNPGTAVGILKIYLSPSHAKRLALALAQTVRQFEELFGEISVDPTQHLTEKGRARFHADVPKLKG
jgi:hypothetical protein